MLFIIKNIFRQIGTLLRTGIILFINLRRLHNNIMIDVF